jgi:hypothetical protein
MMRKAKRDVLGYIDASIEYERGNSKKAPPGGYASGIDKAEADLVYISVRRALAAAGVPVKAEWFPPNAYQAGRLANAYSSRGLDPTPLEI